MAGTRTEVTELYVATFMRAPDALGIEYWVDSPLTIEQIAQSFFDQDETQALYGSPITDYEAFINDIYNNLFNRDPLPAGLDYWVDRLESGDITPGNMILAVVNGALGTDDDILTNKTLVGLDFADSGLSDYDQSVEIMSGITADPATVEVAAAQIEVWEGAEGSENFTTERDTFDDALPSDDIFSGVVNGIDASNTDTYQTWDSVNGGLGNDTLHITSEITGTRTIDAAQILNTETLHITQNSDNGVVVDASNFDDKINNLVIDGSTGAAGNIAIGNSGADGTALKAVLSDIELSVKNQDSHISVFYNDDIVLGDNSSAITLTNDVAQELFSNGIETYTVHTGTGSQALLITDFSNTNIIVDGGGDLKLTATNASHFTLSGTGETTIIYDNFSQSDFNNPDTIVGFTSGTDKINVSDAIYGTIGETGELILPDNFDSAFGGMSEGEAFRNDQAGGATQAYQDRTTFHLYIDTDQSGYFEKDKDMVIDLDVEIYDDDLIV